MFQMNTWSDAWLVLIIIFGGGLVVGKLSEKPRIPDVVAYLVFGILIGPQLLNWVGEPSQSQVNQFVLNLGATLILFDGGRGVELSVLRRVWVTVVLLATLGVAMSAAIVGATAHFVLGGKWIIALMIGAVIASTDPATLIPVFKRVFVIPRLQQTVESESAFNDAIAAALVFTLMSILSMGTQGHIPFGLAAWEFLKSAGIGLVVGMMVGIASLWLLSPKAWGVFHEYASVVMLLAAIASYEVATVLGASGFMATFVAGVITGNARTFGWALEKQTETNVRHFGNVFTLILRMAIFVLLGTQVNFHLVFKYWWAGLVIVGVLMLIARPLVVLACTAFDKRAAWQRNEILFMFWVRETGVIPAALAGMLVARHFPHAAMISAITFVAILLTIVIQASTTDYVATRLGVEVDAEAEDV